MWLRLSLVWSLIKLRYLPDATGEQVCEELEEAIISYGTRPELIRSDDGPPFDSAEYKAFCETEGIVSVLGVAYHSQGQGLVENRFLGLARALIAVLGHKAQQQWFVGPLLGRLEGIINSTYCEPLGGSPYWVLHGVEPRTRAVAAADWSSSDFGSRVLGLESATFNDLNEIVAAHHGRISAVQGGAMLASSLAQALTKRAWDASREKGDFVVGEWVLLHTTAPNRLLPHFTGPFQIVSVTPDGNFVKGRHFLVKPESVEGPFHVSRLLHFDMSRATPTEIAEFQLEAGSAIVESVVNHRVLESGAYEYEIQWMGVPVHSWMPSVGLKKVVKVIEYCVARGLPLPGTEVLRAQVSVRGNSVRGARGGRGRGARGATRGL